MVGNFKSWKTDWRSKFDNGDVGNFNMAILFMIRLNELLERCSEARYNRNQLLYYTALNELWTNLTFKVIEIGEEETEKEINDLFAKVTKYFEGASIRDLEIQRTSITLAEKQLNEISKKINILLYRYGLLMPIPKRKDQKRAVDDF